MKGYALVVRSIATVFNYGYQWDYVFYMDGTIGEAPASAGRAGRLPCRVLVQQPGRPCT